MLKIVMDCKLLITTVCTCIAVAEIRRNAIRRNFSRSVMGVDEANYIFHNYGHLMTPKEALAFSHLGGTMKATLGRSDQAAQEEVKSGSTYFRRWLSDDPEVLLLARDGYDAFVLRTGQRILNDNQNLIVLNYCPRCEGLTRTPQARQCRFCGHDWHSGTNR